MKFRLWLWLNFGLCFGKDIKELNKDFEEHKPNIWVDRRIQCCENTNPKSDYLNKLLERAKEK